MDRKILILEQDAALLEAMRAQLSGSGYEIDGVREPEAAQSLLSHVHYALVIADLALGEAACNGFEVLVSSWNTASRPKTIVFSRNDNPELRESVRRWGADIFLNKPESLKVIIDSAMALLNGRLCRTPY